MSHWHADSGSGPAATPKYAAQAADAAAGVNGAAATVDADPITTSAATPPTTSFFTVQTSPGGESAAT
jgi:hypothetical protein